ncbi:MAG: sodium:solute symporter [Planctomycetaceae bacterium]|jgi:SSS family solute:Na+ symporter|nr:sodium:solute symporter [Planctomycetaceae bacterium]
MAAFTTIDWFVIAIYFAVLLGLVVWSTRWRQESSTDYFLAGRHLGWFVVGASIFASNVGSEHIVGLAGAGAQSGVVFGHFELHSWLILLLGWVFVPIYMRSRVFTMPEFLEQRFSPKARWFLSLVTLVGYVLTKVSVTVYAGGIVFQSLMGIDFWTGAFAIVVLTGIYSIVGGLRAVVYTESLQAIVLIVGSATVTVMGLIEIGGWQALCESVDEGHLDMFLPGDHPDYPWTGMVFAAPIIGLWYWCTDQNIVQRVLAARDETQARRGTIFAGYLKLLPFFIFLVPGLIAHALAKSGRLELPQTDQAFPMLVRTLLPAGVRGLVAGGLLAALMSSLAAVFNSCSTLFTIDIYRKLRPGASEARLVRVGRIATGVVVIAGILWIPLMRNISDQLFHYLNSVQAYLAPPIAAVFFLGLFWKRVNTAGAMTVLVGGFVVGMLRLLAELNSDSLEGWVGDFAEINFLHFCTFLFLGSLATMVGVSLLTRPPVYERLDGLTYGTTAAPDRQRSRQTWNRWDVAHSVVIVAVIVAVFAYFS